MLLSLMATIAFSFTACSSGSRQAQRTAEEHLKMSADHPDKLVIERISEPDSAFGKYYLSQKDKELIYGYMKQVTDTIMKRTRNMEQWNPEDAYVASLAERQMRASAELRNSLYDSQKREDFSGWIVRIAYHGLDHHGLPFHSVRWYFMDKKGRQVIRLLDFPLA
jgi:hypothetical protein